MKLLRRETKRRGLLVTRVEYFTISCVLAANKFQIVKLCQSLMKISLSQMAWKHFLRVQLLGKAECWFLVAKISTGKSAKLQLQKTELLAFCETLVNYLLIILWARVLNQIMNFSCVSTLALHTLVIGKLTLSSQGQLTKAQYFRTHDIELDELSWFKLADSGFHHERIRISASSGKTRNLTYQRHLFSENLIAVGSDLPSHAHTELLGKAESCFD